MLNPSTKKEMKQIKLDDIKINEYGTMLKKTIKKLLNNGYTVLIYESKEGLRDLKFSKDNEYWGYIAQSRTSFGELYTASVNQGHKKHGTGTMVYKSFDKAPSLEILEKTLNDSKQRCKKLGLKPFDHLTFNILEYKEVIL